MAQVLNDVQIRKLLGTVILNGVESSIRPNSYILRLGYDGEFITSGKEFQLSKEGQKGIVVPPGHAVGVTSLENIDFKAETIAEHYPDCSLHGILSPTTDLSREGIVAPATNVDAGFRGTLNWTLNNTSSKERRFVVGERIFRMVLLLLEKDEVPEDYYDGDYQGQTGYIRSRRKGAPVGMKEKDWVTPFEESGPEKLLEQLIRSGYPWNMLGERLATIDRKFQTVTNEYGDIRDSISDIKDQIDGISTSQGAIGEKVREVLRDETQGLQNRWLIGAGTIVLGVFGIVTPFIASEAMQNFMIQNGVWVGLGLLVLTALGMWRIFRKPTR